MLWCLGCGIVDCFLRVYDTQNNNSHVAKLLGSALPPQQVAHKFLNQFSSIEFSNIIMHSHTGRADQAQESQQGITDHPGLVELQPAGGYAVGVMVMVGVSMPRTPPLLD